MRSPALASFLAVSLTAAAAGAAPGAGKAPASKTPPACGARALPLVVGNTWTYTPVASPTPIPEATARLMPTQPKKVTVAVQAVETKAGVTTATLAEVVTTEVATFKDGKEVKAPVDRRITSTITCTAQKFDVSPEAFWFAGEPGGYVGLALDKVERVKGTTWTLPGGTLAQEEWREDLALHWTQVVTPKTDAPSTAGKVELERRFVPQAAESVGTPAGAFNAKKVIIAITGRVTLDAPVGPDPKPYELPQNWNNQLWLVDGVGVVQVLNSYGHMYTLSDVALK